VHFVGLFLSSLREIVLIVTREKSTQIVIVLS